MRPSWDTRARRNQYGGLVLVFLALEMALVGIGRVLAPRWQARRLSAQTRREGYFASIFTAGVSMLRPWRECS